MPDLDEQLRSYFDAIAGEIVSETDSSWGVGASGEHDVVLALDETQLPVTLDDLIHRGANSGLADPSDEQRGDRSSVDVLWEDVDRPTPPERGRWSGVAIAVAAAILIVVGVIVVADDNGGDVVTEPASSPAEADPVPLPSVADPVPAPEVSESGSPASIVDSLGYRWYRVPHDEAVFGGPRNQDMNSVTAGGPGLVAVGAEYPLGVEEANAAVWTSLDGFSWSRVPHDEAVFGGDGHAEMLDVAAGGPGLVAVGHNFGGAAVWTSVDGTSWSRVPHDEAVFGGLQQITEVIVGGPGLVAVGSDGDQDAGTTVAAVWTSVDGLSWSRVPHDEVVFGGARNQTMNSVTAGGPGLVAVGSDGDLHGWGGVAEILAAAVWTSVDGLSWSRVPHDDALFGGAARQSMSGVTAGGPGLVAVGASIGLDDSNNGGAKVWTSADGFTWSRVPHDEALFGDAAMVSITATRQGLVVVGDADLPVVWTSPDGLSWSRVPHEEAVFGRAGSYQNRNNLSRVIATEAGVVAVGVSPPSAAAVWVATPEN